MKLLTWLLKRKVEQKAPRPWLEYFFNGYGACALYGSTYVPERGDYMFCTLAGHTRWIVVGTKSEVVVDGAKAMVRNVTVLLDPAPYQANES